MNSGSPSQNVTAATTYVNELSKRNDADDVLFLCTDIDSGKPGSLRVTEGHFAFSSCKHHAAAHSRLHVVPVFIRSILCGVAFCDLITYSRHKAVKLVRSQLSGMKSRPSAAEVPWGWQQAACSRSQWRKLVPTVCRKHSIRRWQKLLRGFKNPFMSHFLFCNLTDAYTLTPESHVKCSE